MLIVKNTHKALKYKYYCMWLKNDQFVLVIILMLFRERY